MDPKNIIENGMHYFANGFSCSEASLQAGAEYFGVASDCTPAVAAVFGGGVKERGQICGAVSGTLMLIGLLYGKRTLGESNDRARQKAEEFLSFCEETWGTLLCREITGVDLRAPETTPEKKKELESICNPLFQEILLWQTRNLSVTDAKTL